MTRTLTQTERNRKKAYEAVSLRLMGDQFHPFQSWRIVADKMGLKKSELRDLRETDEFVQQTLHVVRGKCKVFADIGRRVKYKMVRDWLKAAFGLKFARAHAKQIWQECSGDFK